MRWLRWSDRDTLRGDLAAGAVGAVVVLPQGIAFATGHGERVEDSAQFAPAFERARASGKPAVIELRIDPDAITPAATLSGLRAAALKNRGHGKAS